MLLRQSLESRPLSYELLVLIEGRWYGPIHIFNLHLVLIAGGIFDVVKFFVLLQMLSIVVNILQGLSINYSRCLFCLSFFYVLLVLRLPRQVRIVQTPDVYAAGLRQSAAFDA